MSEIRPADLFGRLNKLGYRAMEGATTFCKLRGNPRVELVHFLYQVINESDSDLHRIIARFELNPVRISSQMTASLDRLPAGATSISGFSQTLREAVEQGWVYASLMFRQSRVRTGHIIVGLLKNPNLQGFLHGICREFEGIRVDVLTDEFDAVTSGSPEAAMDEAAGGGAAPGEASQAVAGQPGGKQSALAQFSIDLTQRAREGRIDPIYGRDEEIRQIIDILMRRRQNNPILTGEAGVGKTAVVEGFALRIVAGDVPPALRGVTLRTLDLGLLQAGASMKGEFENRLRSVIDEVQASPEPIILFIDEAHQLIGAGGSAGQGDAANLLKPALARGTLRTIAATTWAEYKKYFEKDAALVRRFQVIRIEEPDDARAIAMIRGLAANLEGHHKVLLLDEAVEAAVKLSRRYLPSRQLPDKAVSLIDTAAARVAVSQHATPARLEDVRRSIETSEIELGILQREARAGSDHAARLETVQNRLEGFRGELAELEKRWEVEKNLVTSILDLRGQLAMATGADDDPARAGQLDQLRSLESELRALQGESPLIFPVVDAQAVAEVVSDWTGVPVGRMVQDEVRTVLTLADQLERRVVGQRHALDLIAKRIEAARAGLVDPNKPIGVFMLAGTSGVGKTETALALAELLYGGEQNLITINMSEFQEAHTISTLKGAPPGYVGYGEGGKLTEAVRRKPYSVVLLDEVEKAHSDVHELFFQVFDKGRMEDGEGRLIDFRNTIIILTTNAGTDVIMNLCRDPDLMPEPDGLAKALRDPLLKVFPPALLGRLDVIPYYPLSDDVLRRVIRLQTDRLRRRMEENRGVALHLDPSVEDLIASRCNEIESGGRIVQSIINSTLLPELSRMILTAVSNETPVKSISVTAEDGTFRYTVE